MVFEVLAMDFNCSSCQSSLLQFYNIEESLDMHQNEAGDVSKPQFAIHNGRDPACRFSVRMGKLRAAATYFTRYIFNLQFPDRAFGHLVNLKQYRED